MGGQGTDRHGIPFYVIRGGGGLLFKYRDPPRASEEARVIAERYKFAVEQDNKNCTFIPYLGVAMSPTPDMTTLKRINLIEDKTDKVAVVLFTDEGLVKNKVLSVDSDIFQKDLNRIAGYLNLREYQDTHLTRSGLRS